MRVAALYDIHGNLPALEAVLSEVATADVDRIVVGGDVLWGPFQSECLALLRGVGAVFVSGNCERDVLAAVNESAAWCRDRLTADELALVAGWPMTTELDVAGLGRVLFCHATPRSDNEILTAKTPEADALEMLSEVQADVVVGGHTHVQYDRRLPGEPRLVNAGSVGMPVQGEQGAFWALLAADVELRRTPYAIGPALELLESSGLPDVAEFGDPVRGVARAESASAYFAEKRRRA